MGEQTRMKIMSWRRLLTPILRLSFILAWVSLWGYASVQAAPAQGNITLGSAPPPEYEFGKTMTFQVSARSSGTNIIGASVFVRTPGIGRTFVGEARLTPGIEITAAYALNLSLRPLPPFAPIEYWWEIRDSAGASLTTEPQTFIYEDNRFDWRTLTSGIITVHWHQGDTAFGQLALDVATTAFVEANDAIQAQLEAPVNFYIYPSAAAAQAALGRIWAEAYADPTLGLAVVAVADDEAASLNLQREIPHELTHILIYQVTGDHYADVPIWLDEGLAVMNQAQPNPGFPAALAAARSSGTLFSLSDLCGSFPTDPAQAQLAYAESESVVRYIRDTYGSQHLQDLLKAYADGLGCSAGVERGLGVSLAELEDLWLHEAIHTGPISAPPRPVDLTPWVILTVVVLISPALFFFLIRLRPRPASS